MSSQDPVLFRTKLQAPLNEARSPGTQLGAFFFEQIVSGMTITLHDVELILGIPVYSGVVDAPSYLLTESWTSVPAIPPSRCTHDYMSWFIHRTHPRIQNPDKLPRVVQYLTPGRPSPLVVLNMITPFIDPDTTDESMMYKQICRIMKDFYLYSD
ncbi:hypothetical protein M9H77_00224 [Catharanthus roseus]|nr:hypothetical protein M9H77_00224 [Catharanthus roseus]